MSAKTEYIKARKALQSRIRSLRKRGYIDLEDIVPQTPKRITEASARRLRKINKNIYKKIRYITQDGYVVSGVKGREIEKKRKGKRVEGRVVNISFIENLRERIRGLNPQVRTNIVTSRQKSIIMSILDDNVTFHEMNNTLGKYVEYLKSHESNIAENSNVIFYSSKAEDIIYSFTHLANIINAEPLDLEYLYELSNFSDLYDDLE